MTVENHFDCGPEDRRAIIDTARWVGGTMIFLTAVAAAVIFKIS